MEFKERKKAIANVIKYRQKHVIGLFEFSEMTGIQPRELLEMLENPALATEKEMERIINSFPKRES